MSDVNQSSLPTPFFILFLCLFLFLWPFQLYFISYIFPTILFSDPVLLVLSLPYWSFQLYTSLWKSASALTYIIPSGWLSLKPHLTYKLTVCLYLLYHWSLASQTRCVDVLLLTNPGTTLGIFSNTVSYSITRHTVEGYFAIQDNKPCLFGGIWMCVYVSFGGKG